MKKFFKMMAAAAVCGSALFGASYDEILSNKVIKIGVLNHTPPFSKIGRDGVFSGFEIDISKEIVKKIFDGAVNIEFVGLEVNEREDALLNGKVDLLVADMVNTDEAAQKMEFSLPYLTTEMAVVSKKELGVKHFSDLKDKNILTIKGTEAEKYLLEQGHVLSYCRNNMDCLDKLKTGEGAAYMHNITSVATIPLLDHSYEVSIKEVGEAFMICVAAPKGSSQLVDRINSAIIDLAQAEYFEDEFDKTFEPFYRNTLDKSYFVLDEVYETIF